MSVCRPRFEGWKPPAGVEPNGGLAAWHSTRRAGAAMEHHVEPGAQLAGHRLGKSGGLVVEPSFYGRDAVVLPPSRRGEDLADRADRQAHLAQHLRFASGDGRSGGVLEAEQEPDPGSHVPGALGPSFGR